jgi:hypothetical protein
LTIFGSDHFAERFAHLLDFGLGGFNDHSIIGFGRTGRDGITDAFDLYNAKPVGSESIEPIIVAECRNVFSETAGDLVDGFAFGESGLLTINGDGKLRGDGGAWVVDYVLGCRGIYCKGVVARSLLSDESKNILRRLVCRS